MKTISVDQEVIKESNRKKILNLLSKKREVTKQFISKEIGISIPTVIANINELITEGLVEEAGVAGSTGGRKPVIVRFLPDSKYSFGVEFISNSMRIVLTNLDSQIKQDTVFSTEGMKDIDEIIKAVHYEIEKIIKDKNIANEDILGVGFSLPGTVNEENYILEQAPNMKMKNVDFKRYFQIFELPLYLENEANSAAFAELNLGIVKEMKNLVYISITDGIGTGIVIQDHLYKGKNKRAGEFGHMTVVPDGKECNCGRKGCFEQYASKNAIIIEYNNNNVSPIKNIREFFDKIECKEKLATQVLDRYTDYLALGIQNIALILDPHYVVIGGELSEYSHFFLESLRDKVFVENSFYNREDFKIITSILKQNSSILGASLLPLQKLFFINEKII